MIARVWRGWTAPEDADRYERLLRTQILPDIAAESGDGFRGAEVFRRPDVDEVAFLTILRFASMDAVRHLTGEEVRSAHVPAAARSLLIRFEDEVQHYEVVIDEIE
jgi:antibiotic biosynthesis monooxygenase (ABM) superfamily enzyme